jgi:hypothetical protein
VSQNQRTPTHSEEEDSIEDILVEELGGKTYRVPQHRLKQETNYVSLPVDNEMEENKADRWELSTSPTRADGLGKLLRSL